MKSRSLDNSFNPIEHLESTSEFKKKYTQTTFDLKTLWNCQTTMAK